MKRLDADAWKALGAGTATLAASLLALDTTGGRIDLVPLALAVGCALLVGFATWANSPYDDDVEIDPGRADEDDQGDADNYGRHARKDRER